MLSFIALNLDSSRSLYMGMLLTGEHLLIYVRARIDKLDKIEIKLNKKAVVLRATTDSFFKAPFVILNSHESPQFLLTQL